MQTYFVFLYHSLALFSSSFGGAGRILIPLLFPDETFPFLLPRVLSPRLYYHHVSFLVLSRMITTMLRLSSLHMLFVAWLTTPSPVAAIVPTITKPTRTAHHYTPSHSSTKTSSPTPWPTLPSQGGGGCNQDTAQLCCPTVPLDTSDNPWHYAFYTACKLPRRKKVSQREC